MAKIDTANQIVQEFPEKNFQAEQLVDQYTQEQLNDLHQQLVREKEMNAQSQQAQGQMIQEQNNQQVQGQQAQGQGQVQTQIEPSPEILNGQYNRSAVVSLPEHEQVAREVLDQSDSGTGITGQFRLSNPDTQYAEVYEDGTTFTLAGDQVKSLPNRPSNELIERIRSGYIVRV